MEFSRKGKFCLAVALSFAAQAVPLSSRCHAQGSAPANQEIEMQYAEGLMRLGLPDYAEAVLSKLPGAGPKLKTIKLQVFLSKGDFEKAKTEIAKEPNQDSEDAWAMKLALADAYYAWGKYAEARAIYDGFFQKFPNGPPTPLLEFYATSGYKYAQMLILMNQEKAAVQAFRNTLKAKMEKPVERQLQCEMADLLLKLGEANPAERAANFAEVDGICKKILWIQDVWFGKAIVMMAHMKAINGDLDGAMNLINEYRDQLVQIDEILKQESEEQGHDMTRLSPMAQCRFLVGSILLKEAEKKIADRKPKEEIIPLLLGKKDAQGREMDGAASHFLNVFVRYPTTSWAPEAGTKLKQTEEILKKYGKTIDYRITPDQRARVERAQIQEAKAQFNNQQFEQAANLYQKFLGSFPEGISSVPAITDLALCYVELGQDLYAEAVTHHLAERFHRKKEELMNAAGDGVLLIANAYASRNQPQKAAEIESLFTTQFPKHMRVVGYTFRLGEQRFAKQDYAGAMPYFEQILNSYSNSPLALDAMSRMAACYKETGKPAEEIKMLTAMSAELEKKPTPGAPLIAAKYRLAGAYRELGEKFYPSAFNRFIEIIKLLNGKRDLYERNAEDKEANTKFLEGAMYGRAVLYVQMKPPAGQPEQSYKLAAIKAFEELLTAFPKSANCPAVLAQVGTLWTVMDKPEEAQKAFTRLQKEYPNAPEAKNARFALAMSLLRMGRREQAIAEFKKMFGEDAGKYTEGQLLAAGNELQKAGENEIAIQAYDQVLNKSKERQYQEPAMVGKGRAMVELKQYEQASTVLESVLSTYSNSGYTVECSIGLSKAYNTQAGKESDEKKRLDLFNKAMKAMNKALQYAKDATTRVQCNLILAQISELKARACEQFGPKERIPEYRGKAIGAYQAIMMRQDTTEKAVRPFVEQAFFECIPLMLQINRYADAGEDATRYLKLFPDGKYITQIRTWMNEAKAGEATAAPAAPSAEEKAEK